MAITVDQLETYLDAAATAMASGNYATAITQATAGLAVLSALPAQAKANASLDWSNARQSLTQLLTEARRLQREASAASSGGGLRRTRMKFIRPTT